MLSTTVPACSRPCRRRRARRLRHAWRQERHELLRHERRLAARAPTSAASPAPTRTASARRRRRRDRHDWRAYLSTRRSAAPPASTRATASAAGPWHNAKGGSSRSDVAELHGDGNNLNKQTALTEKGDVVNGRGDTPNQHDILTGSQPDGTAIAGAVDIDLRQLDQQRRRRGDGRPPRPHRPRRERARRSRGTRRTSRAAAARTRCKATGGDGLFLLLRAN